MGGKSKKKSADASENAAATAKEVAMLITQQDQQKRSMKKRDRELKKIEKSFAVAPKDKRKILAIITLMKACEKMKAGKSYTEVVEALDAYCDIPMVRKLIEDLNLEDDDVITEDQWRSLCKDALAALFKDQEILTLVDQALEGLPDRRTGAHLDAFSGTYI